MEDLDAFVLLVVRLTEGTATDQSGLGLRATFATFGAYFIALGILELLFLGNSLVNYDMDFDWNTAPDATQVAIYCLGGLALIMIAKGRFARSPLWAPS